MKRGEKESEGGKNGGGAVKREGKESAGEKKATRLAAPSSRMEAER